MKVTRKIANVITQLSKRVTRLVIRIPADAPARQSAVFLPILLLASRILVSF